MGLPQINEEDVDVIDRSLDELLRKSEATAALLIDKGGPLLSQRGNTEGLDTTTMAALAAGSFCATQAIAERVGETTFNSIYQQGAQSSLFVVSIDENILLIVIFRAAMSVGVIKYYVSATIAQVAGQLEKARLRDPDTCVDLVSLNLIDAGSTFRKKPGEEE